MKIGIIGSMQLTEQMYEVCDELKKLGHDAYLTNLTKPFIGKTDEEKERIKIYQKNNLGAMKEFWNLMQGGDAVLVLNLEKNGQPNYIGGNTFLEMGFAYVLNQKIFLYNPIPEIDLYKTEIEAMKPIIIDGDLSKINPKIEVEIQSFISEEQHKRLLAFFNQNAEFVKDDFQETYYFDTNSNLRIQRNNENAKLWHKSGNVHDEFMEEIEVPVKREDFEKLEKFLNKLGHNVKIKWLRNRKQFNWQGIKVCLDFTKGYGYIIELEKISPELEKEKVLEVLKQKLNELNIYLTPREEFEKQYNYYKENWRNLINGNTS